MGRLINFSAVGVRNPFGRILRFMAYRLVPPDLAIPILQGPAAGKRWLAGSHVPACRLGCYEVEKQSLMASLIKPGAIVADVGAHRGYFTLVASSLTGPEGRVYAFEPVPLNIGYLRKHLEINRISNVEVVALALSDQNGQMRFEEEETRYRNRVGGHLSSSGALEVEVRTLDGLCAEGQVGIPDVIKIDVEGAEALVLRGAEKLLRDHQLTLFIDTHSRAAHADCQHFLESMGYQTTNVHEEAYVLDNGTERYYGDLVAHKPTPLPSAVNQ